jgi:hypothetical protein
MYLYEFTIKSHELNEFSEIQTRGLYIKNTLNIFEEDFKILVEGLFIEIIKHTNLLKTSFSAQSNLIEKSLVDKNNIADERNEVDKSAQLVNEHRTKLNKLTIQVIEEATKKMS